MNKAELIEAIAAADGTPSKSEIRAVLNALQFVITEELVHGGEVRWQGLGTFEVADLKARKGTNPKTGEPTEVPARKAPKFRPSEVLKDKVRGGAGGLA
ncbi:HU family DNA-binding protein [Nonomuraea sp. NN258]|nr:HU family DNA-binding protein [Nonomuraea antri]